MEFHEDMTHYGRVIAGLESVHEHINYNAGIDIDGTYALTVLELHAQDEGQIEGTEGFLDSVKKGANNIVAWIDKIITAIFNFITGKKKSEPKWSDRYGEIHDEEVNKKLEGIYGNALRAIVDHISDEKFEAVRPYFKFMDLDKINDKAKDVLDELKQSSAVRHSSLFRQIRELSKDILEEMDRVKKAISALDLKAAGVGVAANKLTTLAGALGKASEVLMAAWNRHTAVLDEAKLDTERRSKKEEQEKDK